MKKVDFSLDILKKIVSGEVEGELKVKGYTVQQVSIREDSPAFIVWMTHHKEVSYSYPYIYRATGYPEKLQYPHLQLYIDKPEPKLKPFDKVIARNDCQWSAALYSHYVNGLVYPHICVSSSFMEVHPWRDCYAKYLGTNTPWEQIVKETEGEDYERR